MAAITWEVDPSVLTWRGGHELVAYHLRTGHAHRLPGLAAWVRDLLELGGELDLSASLPSPVRAGEDEGGQDGPDADELGALLQMLEREQLVRRVGKTEGETGGDHDKLYLIIASDKSAPKELGNGSAPEAVLRADTVLRRAPDVIVELSNGRTRVSTAKRRSAEEEGVPINGGAHALRLLDAFERPRTIQEVVRVLQGRVREAQGWISLVEALVRLFEGGVLRDVKQEAKQGRPSAKLRS